MHGSNLLGRGELLERYRGISRSIGALSCAKREGCRNKSEYLPLQKIGVRKLAKSLAENFPDGSHLGELEETSA